MSSFLNKNHLATVLGQDSQIERAWAEFYGAGLLSNGIMTLPLAIEQYYSCVGATEWEKAVIYMIIIASELTDGPVVSSEPQYFANYFHLSLRQIRRKFKAMVEKDLIIITPCYDDKGKMTTLRSYDINPFLDKIFAYICQKEEWQRQQSANSNDKPNHGAVLDDLDMLDSCNIEETPMSPDTNLSIEASMSSDTNPSIGTFMSSDTNPAICASMPSNPYPEIETSMSSDTHLSTGTSMSSHSNPSTGTSMSSDQPTSYARTYVHAPDSSSSSKSNINTCINILNTLSSNSNSNSNHDASQFFDVEDDNTSRISTTCPDESQVSEDVRTFSEEDDFEQTSLQVDDNQARFERWISHAIEQANAADEQPSKTDKQFGEASEHEYQASQQAVKAGEQTIASPATLPTMLPTRSREALALISNDFHDAQPDSSRGRACRLYSQFLTINQAEDMYAISDPDLSFSEMMLAVKRHLRNKTFRNRNPYGQPNGMPLFFHELRKRVEEQIITAATRRKDARSVEAAIK